MTGELSSLFTHATVLFMGGLACRFFIDWLIDKIQDQQEKRNREKTIILLVW